MEYKHHCAQCATDWDDTEQYSDCPFCHETNFEPLSVEELEKWQAQVDADHRAEIEHKQRAERLIERARKERPDLFR